MKKKLTYLACAAVIAAPVTVSAADVEVYGKARMALTYAANGDNTAANQDSSVAVSSYDSRLGFKGSEALDNGVTALYQYEVQIELDEENSNAGNSASEFNTRDSYVGLKGDFGTVLMGRLSTPYKNATSGVDAFDDTEGDFNGSGGGIINHNTRSNNAVAYVSNDMSGLKFAAAYVTSVNNDELTQTSSDASRSAISAMADYRKGPLRAIAAYEIINSSTGSDDKAAKVGAQYQVADATKVGLVVDRVTNQEPTVFVNASHKMTDKYTVNVAAAMRQEENSASNDGMRYFAIGATHAYSKTVEVYALYAMVENDSLGTTGLKKVGAAQGETASALSVGMNLNFSTK
jgi:predicted porin